MRLRDFWWEWRDDILGIGLTGGAALVVLAAERIWPAVFAVALPLAFLAWCLLYWMGRRRG